LQVGGVGRLPADCALRRQLVDAAELGGQPLEVLGEPFGGDLVVLPGPAGEADREVGAGRVERAAAAERADRLRAEVQRSPRQPAAEILQLLVAPALGLADLLRPRLRY